MKNAGLTIVELLITIAIISLLAAAVIGRLSDARDSGIEAKIKSELVLIGKRAAIEESRNLTFDTVCGSNGLPQSLEVINIINAIEAFSVESVSCNSNSMAFAVSAAISTTTHWCVDNTGATRPIGSALSTTTPADFICPAS